LIGLVEKVSARPPPRLKNQTRLSFLLSRPLTTGKEAPRVFLSPAADSRTAAANCIAFLSFRHNSKNAPLHSDARTTERRRRFRSLLADVFDDNDDDDDDAETSPVRSLLVLYCFK